MYSRWIVGIFVIIIMLGMGTLHAQVDEQSDPKTHRLAASLSVGDGKGEISYISGIEEMEARGPKSFVVGDDGKIFILDTIASEIEVFQQDGTHLETLKLPEYKEFSDIEIDEDGSLYVLNDLGEIYKFEKNSKSANEIIKYDMSKKIVKMIGLMRSLGSGGVELGHLDGSVLDVSRHEEVSSSRFERQRIENDVVLTSAQKKIKVEYDFIPAGTYPLVEDAHGITYVMENELLLGREAYLETRIGKYDAEGQFIGSALALPTKYEYAVKVPDQFVYVTLDGRVFQMVLRKNAVDIVELFFTKEKRTNISCADAVTYNPMEIK